MFRASGWLETPFVPESGEEAAKKISPLGFDY